MITFVSCGILIGATPPGQSGLGSNGNEGVPLIPQSSWIWASPSDAVLCHTQGTSSIWPLSETLTGANSPGQSGPASNSNEGLHHSP